MLLELFLLITFHEKGGFLCHVLMYKWCQITRSVVYRQQAFGEHSTLPAISVLYVAVIRNMQFVLIYIHVCPFHVLCVSGMSFKLLKLTHAFPILLHRMTCRTSTQWFILGPTWSIWLLNDTDGILLLTCAESIVPALDKSTNK